MSDDVGSGAVVVRGEPGEMARVSGLLTGGAEQLQVALAELDDVVSETLAGWRGDAGGAFSGAWRMWHEGAALVHEGLASMADLLSQAAVAYAGTEESNASSLRAME